MSAMTKGSNGVDNLIEKVAQDAGVPTHALEPYDTIFNVFGQFTPDQQLDMIRAALLTADDGPDPFYTMFEAYFREEHRLIWNFSIDRAIQIAPDKDAALKDVALMEKGLINDRNANWLKVIEAAQDDHLVVAVGAGHLAGEHSVQDYLKARGLKAKRVQ